MKAALFVDHVIGHRLLEWTLAHGAAAGLEATGVVTTLENGARWWPGVEPLARAACLPFARYVPGQDDWLAATAGADYFLLLSWKHLMPASVLRHARIGTVNLHYSLLPELRGVYPVNFALMQGRRETGITYHWVDSSIDGGPPLLQERLAIEAHETAKDLQLRLDDLALAAFPRMLQRLGGGSPPPLERTAPAGGSYCSREMFLASDRIDPERVMRAGDLIDLLRGKTFYPEGRNAYMLDPRTGRKIFLHLLLEPDAPANEPGAQR